MIMTSSEPYFVKHSKMELPPPAILCTGGKCQTAEESEEIKIKDTGRGAVHVPSPAGDDSDPIRSAELTEMYPPKNIIFLEKYVDT